MSFRARRQALGQKNEISNISAETVASDLPQGVNPSPLDGRLVTSTGTKSLDSFLAGHEGLALGNVLLVEEIGNTDFGGYLSKYFTAEGAVQGHKVHVLGVNDTWGRELPNVSTGVKSSSNLNKQGSFDKMKIAWRYERLGEFDTGSRERFVQHAPSSSIFCHDFDLGQRLSLSSYPNIKFLPIQVVCSFEESNISISPFSSYLDYLRSELDGSPHNIVHRVIIPGFLSPFFYSPEFCNPPNILKFFHGLRALHRRYPNQLATMISLPLTLYPRSTGLTRWMELLSDGVLELLPFSSTANLKIFYHGALSTNEEPPQGMLNIHKLPTLHERGGGGFVKGFGENLAFTLSRRKGLIIKPFNLPPVEGQQEQEQNDIKHTHAKITEANIQF